MKIQFSQNTRSNVKLTHSKSQNDKIGIYVSQIIILLITLIMKKSVFTLIKQIFTLLLLKDYNDGINFNRQIQLLYLLK